MTAARVATALLCAAALAGAVARVRVAALHASERPSLDEDSRLYWSGSVHLARHALFSTDNPAGPGPFAPSAERAPLFSSALAFADDGTVPARASGAWRLNGLFAAMTVASVGALGAIVAGPSAGALAAALTAWEPRSFVALATLDIQIFFALCVAAFAAALVSWARRPSLAWAALAGAALGATLCARSTFIAFVPFFAAWWWLREGRGRGAASQLAVFALASVLVALPWAARNARWFGHWRILEKAPVEFVLLSGASGAVSDDYPMEFVSRPGDPTRGELYGAGRSLARRGIFAALLESARRALAAPGRYAESVLLRAQNLWGAWLGAWLLVLYDWRRRRPSAEEWALAAIPVYWNIHLLILSSWRHAIPAFGPLAVLAAAAAARRFAREDRPAGHAWRTALACLVAGLLGAWLLCARSLVAEAVAAPSGAAAAALALERGDAVGALQGAPFQREEAALLFQSSGRPAECLEAYGALAASYPTRGSYANGAAVCAAQAGLWERADDWSRRAVAADAGLDAVLTRGAVLEKRGKPCEARAAYEAGLAAPAERDDPRRALLARSRDALRSCRTP